MVCKLYLNRDVFEKPTVIQTMWYSCRKRHEKLSKTESLEADPHTVCGNILHKILALQIGEESIGFW